MTSLLATAAALALRLGTVFARAPRDVSKRKRSSMPRPRVLVTAPDRELRWLGRPGLSDGKHCIRLVPEAGDTRLIHGERFRGVLLWTMDVHQFGGDLES